VDPMAASIGSTSQRVVRAPKEPLHNLWLRHCRAVLVDIWHETMTEERGWIVFVLNAAFIRPL